MFRTSILTSLLTLSLLWCLPASADADVIFFDHLRVKDCKEFGICDWRVRYKLGPDPQPWKHIGQPGVEADTGDSVTIQEPTIPFDSYPVDLFLEVHEFDAEVASEWWDVVGSAKITINGPGEYWWWFENDEAHVEIYFDAIAEGGSPALGAAAPVKYLGVLEAGNDAHSLIANLDGTGRTWDQFVNSWEQKSAAGQRLVDIESVATPEGRRYYGVYREGNDGYALLAGVQWSTLYDHWMDFEKLGLELIDSENYGKDYDTRYEAVFRTGSNPYNIAQGTWEDFTDTWAQRSASGWRLVDIELRMINGTRYYRGTFHQGTGPYALWVAPRASFVNKWHELTSAGLQLVDVETFIEGGTTWYVGVYRGTVNGQVLLAGQSWADFLSKYAAYVEAGYRLIDFEVYKSGDEPMDLLQAKKTRFRIADNPRLFRRLPSVPRRDAPREPEYVADYVPSPPGMGFVRGDANADLSIEMVDALVILNKLYTGEDKVLCEDAADTNDDGTIGMNDSVQILNFLFSGGQAPAGGPAGEGQEDASPDQLGCAQAFELARLNSVFPVDNSHGPDPVVLLRKVQKVTPIAPVEVPELIPIPIPGPTPVEEPRTPRLPRVAPQQL